MNSTARVDAGFSHTTSSVSIVSACGPFAFTTVVRLSSELLGTVGPDAVTFEAAKLSAV